MMPKPRLILSASVRTLAEFRALAQAAARLADTFDVRVVVSHLAHKNYAALRWPDDPYIQYSYNLTGLFDLVIPEPLEGLFDAAFVAENRALMRQKLNILAEAGLRGAAYVREPAYMPAEVYDRYPDWRGPRIDHPRRSRHPLFALCFHRPEVQALYREAARSLSADFPALDTWVAHTNDAGAGFCWSANLYNGPNGPAGEEAEGPAPAVAAYHRALIGGAADGGVDAISVSASGLVTSDALAAQPLLPEGAYLRVEGSSRVMTLGSAGSMTMPIRHLANPLATLFAAAPLADGTAPEVVFFRFDQPYNTDAEDSESIALELRMLQTAQREGRVGYRRALEVLEDALAERYGMAPAPALTEGYRQLYEHFRVERMAGLMRSLMGPLYGAVSTRWLTRPLVAFQEKLTEEETGHYLPHVFNPRGVEGRRDMLDIHGLKFVGVIDHGPEHALRDGWYEEMSASLERAAATFDAADIPRGATMAQAARLLACVWRTCRNTVEFALLRERASESDHVPAIEYKTYGDPDRQRMYAVLRDEIDNTRRFLALWDIDDPERVVTTAEHARDEDSLTPGPDLRKQMEAKVRIMLDHWEDVERLYKAPLF
jgi:hypothetical protein